jgi:hypothetical protein
MLSMIQRTEVSISGGGLPWELILLIVLLAILVVGLVVWLFRGVRKTINADEEWGYEGYSLMKAESHQKAPAAEAPAMAPTDVPAPVNEPVLETKPTVARPAPIEPVPAQPSPEPPKPVEAPTRPAEPAPPTARRPAPTVGPETVPPVEPPQPAIGLTQPMIAPEEALPTEHLIEGEPSPSPSQPTSSEPFFRAYAYEVAQEHRSRTARLAVTAVVVILVAVYFLVFPVQDAVNSTVASVGQRLSQMLKSQPAASTQLTALPQLDIVQETTLRDHSAVISGRVQNISSDTLVDLFAEFALAPVGVNLTETRLAPIQPSTLAPNQEGTYNIEIRTDEFSQYQLARIVTKDKKEITFKLSLTLPSTSSRQR